MLTQSQETIATGGRGFTDLTNTLLDTVKTAGVKVGLCHLFLHHTSASLVICENADPLVKADLETFMQRIAPDGDPDFQHVSEGVDDMPSHVRTILTQNSITIPITDAMLALGTWQGIYLWEHRLQGHKRKLTITIVS